MEGAGIQLFAARFSARNLSSNVSMPISSSLTIPKATAAERAQGFNDPFEIDAVGSTIDGIFGPAVRILKARVDQQRP